MPFFKKKIKRTSQNIEVGRWGLVDRLISSDETRIVTTPTYMMISPRSGGHAFLTNRQLLFAITEPPYGSESRPLDYGTAIDDITRLVITVEGWLLILYPDRFGNEGSAVLDLYPSPFSQELVSQLRDLWVEKTGRAPEGDWAPWIGPEAPRVSRSARAWVRGK
jgi:hypothetical protein